MYVDQASDECTRGACTAQSLLWPHMYGCAAGGLLMCRSYYLASVKVNSVYSSIVADL